MFLHQYPLATFGRLGREMNRLFDDGLPGFDVFAPLHCKGLPPLNVWEDGDGVYAEAEVPGLKQADLEVQVTGSELTIRGERRHSDDEGTTYRHRERYVGKFARTLTLPFEVDAEKVEATLKDGLLTVKLPKAEAAKARTIPVKSD